ncbi:MAG: energy transducer TonB [Bacteriovoracaceae bacterium]
MIKNRPLLYFSLSLIVHMAFLYMYLPQMREAPKKSLKDDSEEAILKIFLPTKKQIVRSQDSPDKRIKEHSYLSDKHRSFDRQTVAKKTSPFQEGGGGSKEDLSKKELSLSDIGFKKSNNLYQSKPSEQKRGEVSSTNDHIKDVPLGDHTYLNTVEYKYYGFYFRIRQKLEQFWGRSIQETAQKLISEERMISRDDEHVTALRIVLDKKGHITSIKVLGSSGVRELDDAAIKAFNEAGPFPHPPKGLIVKGRVTLQWGFVVKT